MLPVLPDTTIVAAGTASRSVCRCGASWASGTAVAARTSTRDQAVDVAFNPIGQVVGAIHENVARAATVIERW